MQTFKELEGTHRRVPVSLNAAGMTGKGVLSLGGDNSEVELETCPPLPLRTGDEKGWFDLRLGTLENKEILLHNALRQSTTYHGSIREKAVSKIFANVIAFDANHLTDDGRLTHIGFTLA